jgi:AAA+ ATPase superfamily predicted ATPase
MKLGFLNRNAELARLRKLAAANAGTFACVYGRRRCGKSTLLVKAFRRRRCAYYVGDERNASLQRSDLAATIAAIIEGFDQVAYHDWESLLARWYREAPGKSVLVLDEFPYLVAASPELPSLLQKAIDRHRDRPVHLVLCGSSQRMMQGLVLDASAPLYGRAGEILFIQPLEAGWIGDAIGATSPLEAVTAWSIWGGIPRYWELAADFDDVWTAATSLVIDPMGVLHQEPRRLLLDDMRETAQAASLLTLVGRGCHRLSEIASRLNQPASSLSRPLGRLQELGLVTREVPFGASSKSGKKSLYRIADPFLRFWFRYIEPNRSRLEAGQVRDVERAIRSDFANHLGEAWEDLVRRAIGRLKIARTTWLPAARWWGAGLDGKPLELDAVAESADRRALLVAEAKVYLRGEDWPGQSRRLIEKCRRIPFASKYERLVPLLAVAGGKTRRRLDALRVDAGQVLARLR